jgi:ferrochelatase
MSLIQPPPTPRYDALLLVSFGGPERTEEVMPFLENVLRGRDVPRERMLEVAENYYHLGGKSPINDQNRALIEALRAELNTHGPNLPIYWGNRNWHPFLADTVREMKANGVQRALAFVTSAFSSYSGCRQYREDIARARAQVGHGAPEIEKLRVFYNHPLFIETMVERVSEALSRFPQDRRNDADVIFTAHSIPLSMSNTSRYLEQLHEACRLVSEGIGRTVHTLVFQSRSGAPSQPWLEPDVRDHLRSVAAAGRVRDVVVVPIGFISCHMEVMFDLDTQAKALADELGLHMERAHTAGVHPKFIAMIRDLIVERMEGRPQRLAMGQFPANHDCCPEDCCPAPARHRPGVSA